MEPFRFIVERHVFQSLHEPSFDANKRSALLQVLNSSITMQGKTYRSISAMEMLAQSFCRALETARPNLSLPFVDSEDEYEFSQHLRQVG